MVQLFARLCVSHALLPPRGLALTACLHRASNGVLLHAFVYDPETFPTPLGNFITRYSLPYLPPRPLGQVGEWPTERAVVNALAEASRRHYPLAKSHFPAVNIALRQVLPVLATAQTGHSNLVCSFLHPTEPSCSAVFRGFVVQQFIGAAKFFTAIALVSNVIQGKRFFQG